MGRSSETTGWLGESRADALSTLPISNVKTAKD
jgi:hypothetical protein